MSIRNRSAYAAGQLLDDAYFPGSLAARHERIGEPHVAALNALARRIAGDHGQEVPLFDPAGGGRDARVLLLMHAHVPCRSAGSGMVSWHNNDPTAGNTVTACERAGLDYQDAVLWNVIPWWAHDPSRGSIPGRPRSLAEEARRAAPYLAEMLALLPRLRSVVLLGGQAQDAWDRAVRTDEVAVASGPSRIPGCPASWGSLTVAPPREAAGTAPAAVQVLRCPHTSPLAWNTTARDGRPNRDITVAVLAQAATRSAPLTLP